MKKNTKIIQITGFKGLLMVLFVGSCLAAGFIAFPALVAMKCWNYAAEFISIPLLNIWQGLMLWAIVAISGFILNDRKKYLVTFSSPNKLNDEDIKKILNTVKAQAKTHSMDSVLASKESSEVISEEKEKENV